MDIGVDPYSVLKLQKNAQLSVDMLKLQYKKLAEALPVNRGEDVRNTPAFQILTGCYKMVLAELKQKQRQPSVQALAATERFDVEKFNKIFEKTKIEDAYSKANGPIEPNYLKKVHEPSPAQNQSVAFYELGKEYIEDWSGDNLSLRDLNYSDFRLAYNTDKLVDSSTVGHRKEYKSIAELERDRANISFNLSPKEKRKLEKLAAKEKQDEARRQQLQSKLDELSAVKNKEGKSMFFNSR